MRNLALQVKHYDFMSFNYFIRKQSINQYTIFNKYFAQTTEIYLQDGFVLPVKLRYTQPAYHRKLSWFCNRLMDTH